MSIEIPTRWKMQGVNMGCFPACVATLLSQSERFCETWDVMERLSMPYRIEISREGGEVVAGSAVENDSLTQRLLAHHFGFRLSSVYVDNQKEFLLKALELLQEGKAFIASIATSSGGHAIVVYGMDNDNFMIHDPDNGVRFTRPMPTPHYLPVPRQTISKDNLTNLLRRDSSGMFPLGYLDRSDSMSAPPLPSQLLNDSDLRQEDKNDGAIVGVAALRIISDNTKNLGAEIRKAQDEKIYRELYCAHGRQYLKPLVRNLYGAIVASGIVHFHDVERRRINTGILETLDQLNESFLDGIIRIDRSAKVDDEVMENIILRLDELTDWFSALAREVCASEKITE